MDLDVYRECDQEGGKRTGPAIYDGGLKLDYVFSSEPRRWCALGNSAYSDHHVLVESVAVE